MANKFADFAQALAGGDSNQTLKGRLIGGRLQNQGLKNTQLTNEIGERKALFESLAGNKDLTNSIRSGEGFSAGKFNLGKESRAAAGESRLVDGLAALAQSNPEIAKFVSAGVDGPGARAFQRVQNDDDLTESNIGLNLAQELFNDAGSGARDATRDRTINQTGLDTNESVANVLNTNAEAGASKSLAGRRDAQTKLIPDQGAANLKLTNAQTKKFESAKSKLDREIELLGGSEGQQKELNKNARVILANITRENPVVKTIPGKNGEPAKSVSFLDLTPDEQANFVAEQSIALTNRLANAGGGKLDKALAKDGGPSEQQSEQPVSPQASQESFVDAIDEMRSRNPNNPEVLTQLLQRVQSAKGKIPDEEYNRLLRSLQDLI